MPRYAIKVFYLGEKYHGFSIQPNARTVEGELVRALIEGEYIKNRKSARINYASRTDRGVNALSQVVAFNSSKPPILMHINSLLPPDIIVWALASVKDNFNARREALLRHYRYVLVSQSSLDLNAMREVSGLFLGVHDFRSFSADKKEVIRRIDSIKVTKRFSNVYYLDFIGPSFGRRMILRITSALIGVGQRLLKPSDVELALKGKRRLQLKPVPAEGLILYDMKYPPNIKFTVDRKALSLLKRRLENRLLTLMLKTEVSKCMLHSLSAFKY
ncbi:MAG: tRNA pseudouridine(38-40) synthase TruA [Thermoprotei archaeon]|nr:MAG: tRNA pseudouridine(38-40) synthase TruA [Thermoprotei archaeon]RLF02837.1 MAG: tRNA pseudouridine(38-40) synthase TruA [Thermoprotei archaeon]